MNCFHPFKGARDRLERAREALEEAKVALEKQVRELTYKLEVRAEDLSKKEVRRLLKGSSVILRECLGRSMS